MEERTSRKTIRLRKFDYSQPGYYFLTICTLNRSRIFGEIVGAIINRPNTQIALSKYGLIVDDAIKNIPKFYQNIIIEKYVIMPNHIHMILVVKNYIEESGRLIIAPTISNIVKQMKRYTSKKAGFSLWQKSFYDHIIRNEQDYKEIYEYIENNPLKWELDKYFIKE